MAAVKEGRKMTECGNGNGGNDKKMLFISLGVLCAIFLGVTSFVWSSVNRQNLELANSVSALESQIKTMKAASEGTASPEGEKNMASLQKDVRNLNSQVDQLRKDLQSALSRMETMKAELESMAGEGSKIQARLQEAAKKSLAFQKEFLEHLEALTATQEELLSSEQQ
jgi:uncharacterized protein YukE